MFATDFIVAAAGDGHFRPRMSLSIFTAMTVVGLLFVAFSLIANLHAIREVCRRLSVANPRAGCLVGWCLRLAAVALAAVPAYGMVRYGFVRVFFSTPSGTALYSKFLWTNALLGAISATSVFALKTGVFAHAVVQALTQTPTVLTSRVAFNRSRREFVSGGLAAVVAMAGGASWFAGYLATRSPVMNLREMFFSDLPPSFDGLKIALISDLHYECCDAGVIRRGCEIVSAFDPDLLFLLGDYAGSVPSDLDEIVPLLARVTANRPTFAVFGNHDYDSGFRKTPFFGHESFIDEDRMRDFLQRSGAVLLENNSFRIAKGDESVVIAGMDDLWSGRYSWDEALGRTGPDDFVLMLAHNPDLFADEGRHYALMVSGHTHGGQVRMPGMRPWLPTRHKEYVAGAHRRGGRQLFVTVGLGTINPKLRVNCPPEVACLILRRG